MLNVEMLTQIPASWRSHVALAIAVFSGSSAAILVRFAQHDGVPSPVIAAFRLTVGSLVLLPFIFPRYQSYLREMSRKDVFFSALAGFWLAIHLTAVNFSLEHSSVLVSSVLLGTGPLWIALLEVYLLKIHLRRAVWLGLIFALIGGVIIALSGNEGQITLGHNPILGATLAGSAAILSAFYAISGRNIRARVAVLPYIWLVFTSAAITALTMVLLSRATLVGYSPDAYVWLLLLTILPQLVGHGAWNYALGQLTATYTSVVAQLGIIISAIIAFWVFHEEPGLLQLLGYFTIVVGVTLVNLGQPHME